MHGGNVKGWLDVFSKIHTHLLCQMYWTYYWISILYANPDPFLYPPASILKDNLLLSEVKVDVDIKLNAAIKEFTDEVISNVYLFSCAVTNVLNVSL